MKKSLFKNNQKYFHLNLDFETQPLFKNLDWIYLQKSIQTLLTENAIEIHALVMMDTHIHLLIQSLARKENYFSDSLNQKLNEKTGSIADYHSEPITEYTQFLNCYKYIYRNPIKAGLVLKAEEYNYSSLSALLGKSIAYCNFIDCISLIQNPIQTLKWLNNESELKYSRISEFNISL